MSKGKKVFNGCLTSVVILIIIAIIFGITANDDEVSIESVTNELHENTQELTKVDTQKDVINEDHATTVADPQRDLQVELKNFLDYQLTSFSRRGFYRGHTKPIEFEINRFRVNPKTNAIQDITIWIYYAERQFGENSEVATRSFVLWTLDWLVAEGFNPSQQRIDVITNDFYRTEGVTGQAQLVRFGSAHYNYNFDRIDYRVVR